MMLPSFDPSVGKAVLLASGLIESLDMRTRTAREEMSDLIPRLDTLREELVTVLEEINDKKDQEDWEGIEVQLKGLDSLYDEWASLQDRMQAIKSILKDSLLN